MRLCIFFLSTLASRIAVAVRRRKTLHVRSSRAQCYFMYMCVMYMYFMYMRLVRQNCVTLQQKSRNTTQKSSSDLRAQKNTGAHVRSLSSRRIWSKNSKLNMLKVYPVELAAELKTGSRLLTMNTHRQTQLNSTQHSTCSVLFFLPNPSTVVAS